MASSISETADNRLLKNEKYFFVKIVDGKPRIRGQKKCFLGHSIDYDSQGEREGIFVEWEWNGEALHIKTDKFALYPVYYWCDNQGFAISTSIMKLFELGVSKELNYAALGVFLRLGFHIGENTCFKNIEALPPNTNLQWSQGKLSLKTHITVEKPSNLNRNDAIDQYINLFRKSIEKRQPENEDFVVPLSGGRDSRHILLELMYQGNKPKFAVTHEQFAGKSFGEDVRISTALCKELRVKHACLEQSVKYSQIEVKKNFQTGFNTDEHQQMYVLAQYVSDRAHTLYDGIAGDTLSEGSLRWLRSFQLYKEQKFEELAKYCFQKFSCEEDHFRRIFNKQFYDKINFEQAISSLKSELKKHESAADPFAAFIFWSRTRREIALLPYRVLDRVPIVYSPYLDYNLYRFLSSLPAEMLNDGSFHTDAIYRAYPKYAHVPFENEGIQGTRTAVDKKTSERNKEIACYYISQFKFKKNIWNQKYLFPRMLRCLCSNQYAESLKWLPMTRVIFLTQLGNLFYKME